MKEYLEVRHFGPIKKLNVEIKQLTLFIGTQGSGKSTISKLLTICRNVRWLANVLAGKDTLNPFIDFNIDEYFSERTYIHYRCERNAVELTYQDGRFDVKTKNRIDEETVQINSRTMLYIPAERNIVGNLSSALASILLAKIPLSDTIIEYMSLFEKAKKEFPHYEIPFLGVSFEKKEGRERIVVEGNSGKDLPLGACSSGLQSVLPLIMVIDYALKWEYFNSFVIEEPEQNLFPQNQCELLSFITSKQSEAENAFRQFVITTHSPYLLSYLNVLMLAYKLNEHESIREEVSRIVKPEQMVNPDIVAVYSLEPDKDESCRNLIAERTGLISVNALDSASEYIGDSYDNLYRLLLKTKQRKQADGGR